MELNHITRFLKELDDAIYHQELYIFDFLEELYKNHKIRYNEGYSSIPELGGWSIIFHPYQEELYIHFEYENEHIVIRLKEMIPHPDNFEKFSDFIINKTNYLKKQNLKLLSEIDSKQ